MTVEPPIRILSLTFAEDAYQNAQQLNAREVAARLDPTRFEVTLLSDGSGPATILDLPHMKSLRLGKHAQRWTILAKLLRGGFDVLFQPHVGWPEAVFLRLPRVWPSRRRTRVVATVEGDIAQLDEVAPWIRKRALALYRRADSLFPISDHVAAGVRAEIGRDGPVVPVGVDLERFRPVVRETEQRRLRVLSVGKVKDWKRPELARWAAERLPEADFRWVGDGERLETERRAAPGNIEFVGGVDHARLPEAYAWADVLLHPSRMEGVPKVVLEAMASGLPVVLFSAYDPRFVADGGAGFVVTDAEEMLTSLRRLLADAALRASMSRRARVVAEAFSWEHVTARWASIFVDEAAVARGAPSARA